MRGAPAKHAAPANPDGRIADNIVYFARALRKAGMRVGPASVKDAIDAVLAPASAAATISTGRCMRCW
jgi:uncharacterized protein with von Willebrand factor type A (vWA) domain